MQTLEKPRLSIPKQDIRLKAGGLLRYTGPWEPKGGKGINRATPILGGQTTKFELTEEHEAQMRELMVDSGLYYGDKGLLVIASIEAPYTGMSITRPWLHVSLSYRNQDPPWNVIKAVKDAFYPDPAEAFMVLPRASVYVNVMSHCYQLIELPEKWEPMVP